MCFFNSPPPTWKAIKPTSDYIHTPSLPITKKGSVIQVHIFCLYNFKVRYQKLKTRQKYHYNYLFNRYYAVYYTLLLIDSVYCYY